MSDRTFQRPGSVQHLQDEPWPYTSPGFPAPSEPILIPHPSVIPDPKHAGLMSAAASVTPRSHAAPVINRTATMRGTAAMGVVGLIAGLVIGVTVADPPRQRTVTITIESFPLELLGQQRSDVQWSNHSSAPVIQVDRTAFERQLASHKFAYGGDGAAFEYGSMYTLTIVNGPMAVSVPVGGDPSSGAIPTVVSLRSSDTWCVSQQPRIDFKLRPLRGLGTDREGTGAPVAAAPIVHTAQTDCVLLDAHRNLTLRLIGAGPTKSFLETATRFRDALQLVHDELVD